LEFGGPDALTPLQVVSVFEEVAGRHFEVQHVPEQAVQQQYEAAPDQVRKSFSALMIDYMHGDAVDMSETHRRFPFRMTSIRDYAERVLNGAPATAK
jgi:hypothetical protein